MHIIRSNFTIRAFSLFILLNFLLEILFPTLVFALTGGPIQPEFSSFEPVGPNNLVNEFTGDFTYSIPVIEVPGPNGSSYPLSLSYHSGVTPEEEASWVGYGWTLNAGAITRNTRGVPDDYKGQNIKYYNRVPKNYTITAGGGAGFELFGFDNAVPTGTAAIRYNNYNGFGYTVGVGLLLGKGVASLAYNVSDGTGSYSLNLNPAQAMNYIKDNKAAETGTEISAKSIYKSQIKKYGISNVSLTGSNYGVFSYSEVVRPTQVTNFEGKSFNFSVGLQGNPAPVPVGVTGNIFGSYTYHQNVNNGEDNLEAYGFLYAADAEGDNIVHDYYTEKESTYNKRDNFIGIPFGNADNFMVTGQGIRGGFRLYHKSIGQFYPNTKESKVQIFNVGAEVSVGPNFGVGMDIGAGNQSLQETSWKKDISTFSSVNDSDDKDEVYFRFNNDLGGSWTHSSNDSPIQAGLFSTGGGRGNKEYIPDLSGVDLVMNGNEHSQRSSYISYSTNQEIHDAISTGNKYKVYSLDSYLNEQAGRWPTLNPDFEDGIGEFTIFNEAGFRYIYGLPVYGKEEKNLQYGVQGLHSSEITNNYLASHGNPNTLVGEERVKPYASQFLLTEITTPDFVDRTLNGPSIDDFGGYTRFNYKKIYGYGRNFYKWRIPYQGLLYQRNSLSDPLDDMGAVSEGMKEIYYLQSIETKTHVAIFKTLQRNDGRDASQGMGLRLEQLNSIDLYSVSDFAKDTEGNLIRNSDGSLTPIWGKKPIKTVRFQYAFGSEALSKGLPNGPDGKLTLQRMWFEYNGLYYDGNNLKISPYTFSYDYPDYSTYPTKYQSGSAEDVTSNYMQFSPSGPYTIYQNPDYSPFNIDAWGNYQYNGAARYANMKGWVDQGKAAPQFDPAAWQLKRIRLPSGGEIHVQYEQDDYAYVQNKLAHAMVSFLPEPGGSDGNKYYLNETDLGLSVEELPELLKIIKKQYLESQEKRKIYFRFLYNLYGNNIPQIEDCNVEYITGYADIRDVGIDSNGLYVVLGSGSSDYELPQQVCKDFFKSQRAGKLTPDGNCDPSVTGIADQNKSPEELVRQLIGMANSITMPENICAKLNYQLSYLRVPVTHAKKGGGLRVKRLLQYDKGFEENETPVLYGNEYLYEHYDKDLGKWRTSGVATNEPTSIREENILVDYMERGEQSFINRIIAGKDKKQSEGPLGESIYPGASVGYSRVVVRNIHSGKTNPGFTIKEFYTAKDFPVKTEKTDLSTKDDYLPLPTGLYNTFINNIWMTQGFSFILNSMHGQVKRIANYNGSYNDVRSLERSTLVTEQTFAYYEPQEEIPVTSRFGGVTMQSPGKETEITFAQKAVKDHMFDGNAEFDGTLSIMGIFPIPFLTFMPSVTETQSEIYTHATSKIVRYPAILKKSTVYQDGIYHTSEYLAFDEHTGSPVTVKSFDEFSGTFINQSHPATWEYDNMKPISINEGKKIKNDDGLAIVYINEEHEYLEFYGSTGTESCKQLNNFNRGDLIEILDTDDLISIYHVERLDYSNDRLRVVPSMINENTPGSVIVEIKVIRSGRTNQLNEVAGQTVFHSTNKNYTLPLSNEGDRYRTTSFTAALTNAANGSATSPLAGPFSHVNISGFGLILENEVCIGNISDATIRNVAFENKYQEEEEINSFRILSFEVQCANGSWERVD